MRRFPNLLVGLSLGADDPALLAHVSALAPLLGVERIRLVHVVSGPSDAALPTEVVDYVSAALNDAARGINEPTKTSILAGGVALRLLQEAVEHDVDLICLGRGGEGHSAALGTSAGAIVRKAPCSVLVVPRDQEVDLGRAIVPIDFSDRSREALDMALGLADSTGVGAVLAVHAWELPLGWEKAGVPKDERIERGQREARDQWNAWARDVTGNAKLGFRAVRDPVSHVAKAPHGPTLIAEINAQAPGLVVTTSRGRSPGAALLLGSVAARLVNRVHAPCLVLKHKGETMGVLDALRIL